MAPSVEAPVLDLDIVKKNGINEPLLHSKDELAIPDEKSVDYNQDMKWHNVVAIFLVHVVSIYAFLTVIPVLKFSTFVFCTYFYTRICLLILC